MADKHVRITIEFDIDEEALQEHGVQAEDVFHSLTFRETDIDGFEVLSNVPGFPCDYNFFLCNGQMVSKEIVSQRSKGDGLDNLRDMVVEEIEANGHVYVDELAYESAKTLKKLSLSDKILAAQDASSLSLDERVELLQGCKGYEAFSYDYEILKNTASGSSLPGITASVWLEKLSALSFDDLRSYVDRYTAGTLDPSHTHDSFVDSRRVQQKQEKHIDR